MKTTKAGGMMHKPFLSKREKGTARPAKGKILAKPGETRARMIQSPGMKKWDKAKGAVS